MESSDFRVSGRLLVREPAYSAVSIKVRFRGLAKNITQIVTLFALANPYLARKRLLPTTG